MNTTQYTNYEELLEKALQRAIRLDLTEFVREINRIANQPFPTDKDIAILKITMDTKNVEHLKQFRIWRGVVIIPGVKNYKEYTLTEDGWKGRKKTRINTGAKKELARYN